MVGFLCLCDHKWNAQYISFVVSFSLEWNNLIYCLVSRAQRIYIDEEELEFLRNFSLANDCAKSLIDKTMKRDEKKQGIRIVETLQKLRTGFYQM